jgi:hypothetical protein
MSDNSCIICFDNISIDSSLSKKNDNIPKKMTKLDCKHNFHTNCIEEWIKTSNTCPICRNVVKKEDHIIIPQQVPVQNNHRREEEYIIINRRPKKNKMLIISLLLFIFSIINFGHFYTISYKYINNFELNLNNSEPNCTTIVNEIVVNNDCPKLSTIDLTFIILGAIIYALLFMGYIIQYSLNKKINMACFIVINLICAVFIGLYYTINLSSQFDNINTYYTNNQCFNSSIQRNFIISVCLFYGFFILYILTYIYG